LLNNGNTVFVTENGGGVGETRLITDGDLASVIHTATTKKRAPIFRPAFGMFIPNEECYTEFD
jgi:hypothetical protein